ncbi:MAG: sarcosine oxidase subunit delta [Pseudomonadota bacterium]
MLRIPCPVCGLRDETEFSYGGHASVKRPAMAETDPKAWMNYVFYRDNPRGRHLEFWHHVQGCRQWLVVERDTVSHVISDCRLAREDAR